MDAVSVLARRISVFLATAFLLPMGVEVARAADCMPLWTIPGFEALAAVEVRSWDAARILAAGNQVAVGGRRCSQNYVHTTGRPVLSDQGVHSAFLDALKGDGVGVLLAEEWRTVARPHGAAGETRVRITRQDEAIDVVMDNHPLNRQVLTSPDERDYAPLGHMPGYVAASPEWRDFDQRVFQLRDSEETVQGRRFEVDYTLRDGAAPASDMDIQENYRVALLAAGADVLFADERNTTARLDRGGQAIWIKVWSEESAINVTVIEQGEHKRTLQSPSERDYPRLGRMWGYVVDAVERKMLDELIYSVQDGAEVREVKVQGARTEISYAPRAGVMPASDLDIQLNYRKALGDLGAQILFTDAATTVARFAENEALVWVKVWSEETAIALSIVQERAFKSAVKPIPAETLRAALEGRGRVALFLPFIFDRPMLRGDSAPMLAEVVRLMGEMRGLRLLIENHSDNIGPRARNLALTAARAERVREALVAAGADPLRLRTAGIGPDRPVTDNATSEARARNRRTVLIQE